MGESEVLGCLRPFLTSVPVCIAFLLHGEYKELQALKDLCLRRCEKLERLPDSIGTLQVLNQHSTAHASFSGSQIPWSDP